MFDITLSLADRIYAISHVLLVVGAVLALLGSIGVFWSGGIRERFSDQRIAFNEAETAKAQAEAAKANEKVAELENETAKAKLETERLKRELSWRRLSPKAHQLLVAALRGKLPEGVWIETVGTDPEAMELHADITRAFEEAGITVQGFTGWERAVGIGIANGSSESREVVRKAFRSIGIVLFENKTGMLKSNDKVEIIVGTKPPPEFR